MSKYYFNEGALDIPDSWKDQSVNIFSARKDNKPGASFVISREDKGKHADVNSFVKTQLQKLESELDSFKLIREINTSIDNVPAVVVEFSWKSHTGLIRQIQSHVFTKKGKALSYTYTMPDNLMNKTVYDEFQSLISGTKLRE